MPFTASQFFDVFSKYNTALGVTVWLFYLIAGIAIFNIAKKKKLAVPISVGFLSLLWFWMGIVYHWIFFLDINPAAKLFGAIFVSEGVLILYALLKNWLTLPRERNTWAYAFAAVLIFYALVIYPLLGLYFGHGYPAGPIFGLPCPTTIFTFGILMMLDGSKKRLAVLHIIPFAWSVIATFAAVTMGVYEDYALIVSAVIAGIFLFRK